MRIAALTILGLAATFTAMPQPSNVMLAGFGLLALGLLALGSIGHERRRR
jgi:MYXO-CTERM domain-containing protein